MILFIISVSHRPPQMAHFGLLSFSYTRMTFLQGMAGIYANNFIPNTCSFYFLRHILLVHTSLLKKIIKIPHSFISHTETHTHAYISCEQRLFRPRHCYMSPTVLVIGLFNSCRAMKHCSCLHLSSPVDDRWEPEKPWCSTMPISAFAYKAAPSRVSCWDA